MTDRIRIAQSYYGYDPETSPQMEVQRAEEWLGRFTWEVDYLTELIRNIDDNEVYQGSDSSDHELVVQRRPIEKITAKQVWLAETRLYPAQRLPRQDLGIGEVWRDHRTYCFGRHLRTKLQEKLDIARRHKIEAQENVEFLRAQIATGGIVLSESMLNEIERIVASLQPHRNADMLGDASPTIDWRKLGF